MRPDERDAAYLWDMLDSARTIGDFVQGVKLHGYLQDRKLQLAIERSLEILGEAARKVLDGLKQEHPEIPWKEIVGQRNVLAHEYGEIKQERLWRVSTQNIPELVSKLEPLVPEPPEIKD